MSAEHCEFLGGQFRGFIEDRLRNFQFSYLMESGCQCQRGDLFPGNSHRACKNCAVCRHPFRVITSRDVEP